MKNSKKVLRNISIVVAIVVGVGLSVGQIPGPALALDGQGTADNPYKIASCTDLQDMQADLDAHYELIANIDCATSTNWNGGVGFEPVGDASTPFQGSLDGNFHTISDLSIDRAGEDRVGLFGQVGGGTSQVIKEIQLVEVRVTGGERTGALIGMNAGADIIECIVGGQISGDDSTGGLIGYSVNGDLRRSSSSSVQVEGSNNGGEPGGTGGLVGLFDGGEFAENYTAADDIDTQVQGVDNVGGLVGRVDNAQIHDAYAVAQVSGSGASIGGLAGGISNGGATRVYANSQVDGSGADVGGLVGYADELTSSFAIGEVSGDAAVMGDTSASGIDDVYYNEVWGLFCYAGLSSHTDDPECTAIDLDADADYFGTQTSAVYTTPVSGEVWDFDAVWVMMDDLPTLRKDLITEYTGIPNDSDANFDTIPDQSQPNVSGFVNSITSEYAVLETDDACDVVTAQVINESTNQAADAAYSYPLGLMDFTVNCGSPGFTTTVRHFYFDAELSSLVMRKYNATTNTYQTIDPATIEASQIGGVDVVTVSYDVTDGGPLDQDGTTNGVIVDPAGLGEVVVTAPNTGLGAPD